MASQDPASATAPTFCRACGKPIEADARFCRFCGKPQAEGASIGPTATKPAPAADARSRKPSSAAPDWFETRLRQLFPRHHLQDDFMQVASVAVFFMAVIGFVLGFFPAYTWLADNFLLGAIALVLFLILRESTLSHIRARGGPDTGPSLAGDRYQATRPTSATNPGDAPAEAVTNQSSPPASVSRRPPPPPPGPGQ